MGFMLQLDLPSDLAIDGAVIVQSVQYRKKYSTSADYTTVECKVVVGDSSKTEVFNYKSDSSITGLTDDGSAQTSYDATGSDYKLTEDDASSTGAEFYRAREGDEESYKTEQYGEYTGNKKQSCLVTLEFPKTNFDEEWFGSYDIELTARIYESEWADTFVEVERTKTETDFQPPVYSDPELVEEIEKQENIVAQNFMYEEHTFDMSEFISGSTEQGTQTIIGTLFVSPDETADQKVEI